MSNCVFKNIGAEGPRSRPREALCSFLLLYSKCSDNRNHYSLVKAVKTKNVVGYFGSLKELFKDTIRLNTGAPGTLSLQSAQKNPFRTN